MDGHIILLTISRRCYYYYYPYGCPRAHEQVSVAILGFTWAASWPSLGRRPGLHSRILNLDLTQVVPSKLVCPWRPLVKSE